MLPHGLRLREIPKWLWLCGSGLGGDAGTTATDTLDVDDGGVPEERGSDRGPPGDCRDCTSGATLRHSAWRRFCEARVSAGEEASPGSDTTDAFEDTIFSAISRRRRCV